ncbi:serine carboxypeptidase S28-domain-containing protein [Suillus subaureus]|uniref:Serine carboxypeptidase S28-domain-containing protein n=1 Tax=Suillus subaureus TaxID=48587 RepID=A0A9P7JEA4_9AGAM|nr:serine carboxypeptidase S28-domain-containing protein [Suillus subaureus]KAG1817240.1 serine carboxypeptidase S28-domain-containing protein [Suillus subaureus]
MMWIALLILSGLARAAIPNAMLRGMPSLPKLPVPERFLTSFNGTALPPITTVYYFDQLIDHNNSDLGTFKQRYWMNWEFYEPGGPIILMTPGEGDADGYEGYTTNVTINGRIAQQQNGAAIVIEHRFFGYSNPYDNLTSQSLALLTIQQAIDDFAYFATTADLPMPGGDAVKPGQAPWILIGGSYSGGLTSWTMPGIFWAGYASSAVVEAITYVISPRISHHSDCFSFRYNQLNVSAYNVDFYDYFTPIREYMPQNCSSDVQAVIAYLDRMFAANDTAGIQTLKETFGLGDVVHVDDFASALQYNLYDWQSLQPDVGPGAMFFEFCDALEVKDGVSAGPQGWGLDNAIYSWGNFWNTTYYDYVCGDGGAEACLGTYNTSQSYWTNVTINNAERSWFWMVCNQVGWYQVGPPEGQPAIVSRILQPIYEERQCVNMFPQAFAYPPQPTTAQTDIMYAGWNVNIPRLFFANGLRDPWRDATVSADGLNKSNTLSMPIYEGDGFHCSDMITENGIVDSTIAAVQEAA